MKKILLFALAIQSLSLVAQNERLIVASGGKYEFGPVKTDKAVIGWVDFQNDSYNVFDTIQVESVQHLSQYINGQITEEIFLSAEDSVVVYEEINNAKGYQRKGKISYPAVKMTKANKDYLAVGKWYGVGSFLSVYDRSNLSLIHEFIEVKGEVSDLLFIGQDTLLVLSKLSDNSGNDSLIELHLLDLSIERGLDKLTFDPAIYYNSSLTRLSDGNVLFFGGGKFNVYDRNLNLSFIQEIAPVKLLTTYGADEMQFLEPEGNVYSVTYDKVMEKFVLGANPIFDSKGLNSIRMKNNTGWYKTDYSTFGKVFNSNVSDSVTVGISPDAMLYVKPNFVTGIQSYDNESISISLFNEQINLLTFDFGQLIDLNGNLILEDNARFENTSNLPAGSYILNIQENGTRRKLKYLKF